jgi:DNA-binding MarR family transcriptional regulator
MDAFARLLRAHAALTRELSARLLTDHGLSITDYQCLLALAHSEGGEMRRVDLAEQLMLTPSGVTRLLDGLERDGWVTKGTCASDARVTYAVLTEEGRERLESAGRSHVVQVRELIEAQLSPEELETLTELLGRLPGGSSGQGEACSI